MDDGISGNETADRLAAEGITYNNIEVDIKLDVEELKKSMKRYTDERVARPIWNSSNEIFPPSNNPQYKILSLEMENQT
jgi:hypothetical protein